MRIKITAKMIGIVFSLSIILFSIIINSNAATYNRDLVDSFVDRARATAYSLEAGVESRQTIENKDEMLLLIQKQMWLDPEIMDISFNLLREGRLVTYVSSSPGNIGEVPREDNFDAYEENKFLHQIVQRNGERTLGVVTPVHISGQVVGTIQIDFSLEKIDEKIESTIITEILIYMGIMFLFVLLLFIFLRKAVIKPILKISKGMGDIGRGKIYRANVKSGDELGELSRNLEKTGRELKESRKELEKYSKELEKQVKERTDEVEKSKKELETKVTELEKFTKLAVGRELKMVELKKRIKELETKARGKNVPEKEKKFPDRKGGMK